MKLVREDPPRPGQRAGRPGIWGAESTFLKAHPNEWYVLKTVSRTASKNVKAGIRAFTTHIGKGTLTAFRPGGSFEAMSRIHEDGTIKLYVRFVGEVTE